MNGATKMTRQTAGTARERGSALLVSLMIMVGLSLLGLGFVAISETENTISLNERNYTQSLQVAEAGARAVVEWYQNPQRMFALGIMPATADKTNFLRDRIIGQNGGAPASIGIYKEYEPTIFCCDRPFKPFDADRLWGTADSPDILIRARNADGTVNAAGNAFLNGTNGFNERLFGLHPDVRVAEIRVYAPPIIGGTVNASGFYDKTPSTIRYGLATVAVTSEKRRDRFDPNSPIVGRRTVKIVISEWPFPGPQGPVQSNANIQIGGSIVVHWGKMTAQRDMFIKRPLVGLPWMNATEQAWFQYGYYPPARPWIANLTLYRGDAVYPSTAGDWDYIVTATTTNPGSTGTTEPDWSTAAGTPPVLSSNGVTYERRAKSPFRIEPGSVPHNDYPWLYELVNRSYQDPWIEARAFGAITNNIIGSQGKTGVYHPFKYWAGDDPVAEPQAGFSNWFQLQTETAPPDRKLVVFPRIDYQFWKDTAVSGQGQTGVYYLQWVSGDIFRDSTGVQKTFKQWTNIASGADRGFYFFDTKSGQNPQIPGGDTFLTPSVDITSGGGNIWTMSGFIYLNAASFGTQGVRGVDGRFGFPGEPFQDVGFPDVDLATAGGPWIPDPADPTKWTIIRAGNGQWDWKDANGNGKFDLFLQQKTIQRQNGGVVTNVWLPVQYYPGCTPGSNGDPGANCSDPHEPYLNIIYPQDACCTGPSEPNPMVIGWQDPANQTRRPKRYVGDDGKTLPALSGNDICTDSSQFEYCTSNLYDDRGYLDRWTSGDAPVLDGVFYNEGTMSSQGNARYFGSVLINKDIDNQGTNEVWFDERLIRDEWPPKDWPFPRVVITAVQTDQ
jgi:hypothetical protein